MVSVPFLYTCFTQKRLSETTVDFEISLKFMSSSSASIFSYDTKLGIDLSSCPRLTSELLTIQRPRRPWFLINWEGGILRTEVRINLAITESKKGFRTGSFLIIKNAQRNILCSIWDYQRLTVCWIDYNRPSQRYGGAGSSVVDNQKWTVSRLLGQVI